MRNLNEYIAREANKEAGFIRCHPWRSPFGPAKAVQNYSR